jgi:hypothetical protein
VTLGNGWFEFRPLVTQMLDLFSEKLLVNFNVAPVQFGDSGDSKHVLSVAKYL